MAVRFRNSSYSLVGNHKDHWVDAVQQIMAACCDSRAKVVVLCVRY